MRAWGPFRATRATMHSTHASHARLTLGMCALKTASHCSNVQPSLRYANPDTVAMMGLELPGNWLVPNLMCDHPELIHLDILSAQLGLEPIEAAGRRQRL